ncbi:hypothetical protein [Peribacillus sp. SCS-155]|uniref:hypothetical protein n=1 Tax=Peribacillus sedimenti TaxID=3115297 RepID=UPI003905CD42
MPNGKELKQLPMSNIAPGAGPDHDSKWSRNDLGYGPIPDSKDGTVPKPKTSE